MNCRRECSGSVIWARKSAMQNSNAHTLSHTKRSTTAMATQALLSPLLEALEALPPAALVTASAVTILTLLVLARLVQNSLPGSAPPIFEGIPFIGGILKFVKDKPMKLMTDGYAQLGEVFTVPVAHKSLTFLIGPDVASHFFKATDDEMSNTEPYSFNAPTFGPGVVYDVDQKTRVEQFRWFTEALKKERMRKYVPLFVMEAEKYVEENWGAEGVVDLFVEFSKLIVLSAARTLLGREVREQLFDQVATLLHDLDEGMVPLTVFFPHLPIPVHLRRNKARQELRRVFGGIIEARRASGAREEDVLQQFIDARYQNVNNGRAANVDEITGLLIAVLFAGQHTSSITTTWTAYHMIADKDRSFKAAVEEQRAMLAHHGNTLDYDVLMGMEVMHRNITEALRMHPPLVMLMRLVKHPFTVTTSTGKTYTIPKGHVCATSPSFNHMLPHVFPQPHQYDPDRFAPPREEDKAKPFSFVGFGGGRHACIGSNFAYLQIKAILSVLLRKYDFEMLDPVPQPNYNSMVIGPLPCRVRYTLRKQPLTAAAK